MITLYNVISEDGFIAGTDGGEDFIPESYWQHTLEVIRQYDCVVLGRNTYETIQNYEKEFRDSFDELSVKKIVVTSDVNYQAKEGYEIINAPEDIIKFGINILVTSGPVLNNYLLDKNLVDRIIYHEVPVSIHEGIRPYKITLSQHIPTLRLKINE